LDSDSKKFELVVKTEKDVAKRFTVPFLSKKFGMLTWLGFSSAGNSDSVFYIDDIKLVQ